MYQGARMTDQLIIKTFCAEESITSHNMTNTGGFWGQLNSRCFSKNHTAPDLMQQPSQTQLPDSPRLRHRLSFDEAGPKWIKMDPVLV